MAEDMAERQPYHTPIQEPQRTSHEGGNGAPGLPRTVHESAKPPPPESRSKPTLPQESPAKDPHSRMLEKTGDGHATFRCVVPKLIFSPLDIPRLYDHEISTEEAIKQGQPWVEKVRTLDSQELERRLGAMERSKRESPRLLKRDQYIELLEYQIEVIREQLRQREG